MIRKVGYGDSTAAPAAEHTPRPAPRFPRRAVVWSIAFLAVGILGLYLAMEAINSGRVERFALFAVLGVGILVTGVSRLLKMALGLAPGGGPRRRQ